MKLRRFSCLVILLRILDLGLSFETPKVLSSVKRTPLPASVATETEPALLGQNRLMLDTNDQKKRSYYHFNAVEEVGNSWKSLVPPLWSRSTGPDVVVEWSNLEDTRQVAKRMVQLCACDTKVNLESLSKYLDAFREICLSELDVGEDFRLKARIVASRGPSGTKCPQWHLDHVPVRWIQSLVGRGCEIVKDGSSGVNWGAVNGLGQDNDDDEVVGSVTDRNDQLVDASRAEILRAKEGEILILKGNRWRELSRLDSIPVHPALHKSPAPIPLLEGRVLLTQDVLVA